MKKDRIWHFIFVVCTLALIVPSTWWTNLTNRTIVTHSKLVHAIRREWHKRKVQTCFVQPNYALELNDRLRHYLHHSFTSGIGKIPTRPKDLLPFIYRGELVWVGPTEYYELDTMYYSYPYLTPKTLIFLKELGQRFHEKLENTGLECTRFTLTSLTRTTNSVKRLKKRNRNSVTNSSHLHGTTFDVSYRTFFGHRSFTASEIDFLAFVLSKALWEMREENKCWATYETWQTCFHVVVK